MGVGTSLGKTFDDLFHFHQNQYDPDKFPAHDEEKSDIQNAVDNKTKGVTVEHDPGLILNTLEMSPDTNPKDSMTMDKMMIQKSEGNDPGNIYSDSGDIVDYDNSQGDPWGKGDLPTIKPINPLIQPLSPTDFNEIDALADK